jgi:hypothetical protein
MVIQWHNNDFLSLREAGKQLSVRFHIKGHIIHSVSIWEVRGDGTKIW